MANQSLSLIYTNAIKIDENDSELGILDYANDGRSMLEKKVGFHLAIWRMKSYNLLKDKFNGNLQIAYDIDLYMKLEEIGDTHFLNKPLYKYRVHNNNISIGFDKLGASFTERIISRWEAQKRRGVQDTKVLGEELQQVFNKIQKKSLTWNDEHDFYAL